jgi:hypothetical protein
LSKQAVHSKRERRPERGYAMLVRMTAIEDLEKAVAELPPDQLQRFRACFAEFEAARFDQRIEQDAKGIRLCN